MSTETTVPNAKRLLWAGFMAILAAGVGFALRGGIFGAWASEYGFNASQLGAIGGAGFSGFCFGIIIGGVIVDKIGYGKLVALALLGHIVSAFVTFGASSPQNAYDFLYWGMFIFAFANGTLEAVANPLVATIFPKQRTHYLNILHASWPLGMVVGAVASYLLGSVMGLGWKAQLSFYLVPTIAYAIMFMGQSFPKSEAAEKGASFSEMFKDVGILGSLVACYLLSIFLGNVLGPVFNVPNLGLILAGVLLVAVGVRDIDDLANGDPDMLLNMLDEFCDTSDGQRILRDAAPPDEEELRGWIETAQDQQARDAEEDETEEGSAEDDEDEDEDERSAA